MSSEITVKIQSLLWWVSSIAVSVLCCSMLFVVFASYMVEIKASVQNNNVRIESVEAREDKIIFELDALQKRIAPVAAPPVAVAPPATTAPASDATAPVITPPAVPAASAPAMPEATAPIAPTPLSSSTPPTPEKK
jgi:uncharacterized membrane protein